MTAAILFLLCLLEFEPTSRQPANAANADRPGAVKKGAAGEIDYATEHLKSIDSATVVLSPRYLRAIHAVEAFRGSHQRHVLSSSERDLMNFNIHIIGGLELAHETWLTPAQREDCYVIALVARPRPGEKVFLHASAAAGRTTKYAVSKRDYSVVKSEFVVKK